MSADNPAGYEDMVVLVTGASAGLGRQYARDFAKHGARVVVHGRSAATEGAADEINAAGGRAIAVQCDAEDGAHIVAAACDAFGRLDALVINAGLVRDKSFARMSAEDWREVIGVHLHGAYTCLAAAWPLMSARRFGRVVITSSGAGLYGRFGQANYAAAKAGLIGLTRALAMEGARRHILVNAVAPWAATGMTETVFSDALRAALRADRVSPFVLALCHPRSTETGAILEVGGGWAAKLRWERAVGRRFEDAELTPENIIAQWADVGDFARGAVHPQTTDDTLPFFGLAASDAVLKG